MNRFLEAMPVERHIYQDYTTLARLLVKEKQPQQALDAFQKAVAIDSTKTDTYKEMATIALNAALYPEAVNCYEKYFEVGSAFESMDYFFYGQANHMAASYYILPENTVSATTPEAVAAYETTFRNYIQKGDSAFAEVTKRVPASHIGYLWRGNINALKDKYDGDKTGKVEGYAKPHFEEALAIMLAKNENGARNREIIEVYRYLASYYYSIEDKDTTAVIEYNKKILEINPDDELAKKTLSLLKVKY
jgi:tetratricopeptide (TPR) repeat protein